MKLRMQNIGRISPTIVRGLRELSVEVEMTEGQMLDAILEFLTKISGPTWEEWKETIEKETA